MNINKNKWSMNFASLNLIYKLWRLLSKKRKIQLFFLLSLMTISGILEITLIRNLLPLINNFINTLPATENLVIFNNFQIFIRKFIDINTNSLNIIFYSLIVLITTSLKLVTLWINERYTAAVGNDITNAAFSTSIRLPYALQIDKNSSELIAATIKYCDDTTQFIKALIKGIYYCFIAISISIGLFWINFSISFLAVVILLFIYFILSNFTKNILIINGKKVTSSYNYQTKLVQEGLGSIRDLIINKSFDFYEANFLKSDVLKRKAFGDNNFIASFPKVLLEGLGIMVVLLLLYFLNLFNSDGNVQNFGVIAAFALGCQKLLPALQTIYMTLSRLRSGRESVTKIINITRNNCQNYNTFLEINSCEKKELNFKNIKLDKIYFKYKSSKNWAISGLSVNINKGEKIGIIGPTGCGKSTLLDLILGLLKPSKGRVTFNNIDLNSDKGDAYLTKLHSITSYVPQNIYVSDSSVYQNIAHGLELKSIDLEKVIECSKKAYLHDVIISKPEQYNTILGERGINLSGGQIQRLGIARALFKNPKILILDEATSALDSITEKKVLDSIYRLTKNITLIIISHNLNTVANCDKVLEFENGNLKNILSKSEIKMRIKSENF